MSVNLGEAPASRIGCNMSSAVCVRSDRRRRLWRLSNSLASVTGSALSQGADIGYLSEPIISRGSAFAQFLRRGFFFRRARSLQPLGDVLARREPRSMALSRRAEFGVERTR